MDESNEKKRCKAITKTTPYQQGGQCHHPAVEGSDFCAIHLGRKRSRIARCPYLSNIMTLLSVDTPIIDIHKFLKNKGFEVSYVNLTKYTRKLKIRMGLI